jgi:hypothetical protein
MKQRSVRWNQREVLLSCAANSQDVGILVRPEYVYIKACILSRLQSKMPIRFGSLDNYFLTGLKKSSIYKVKSVTARSLPDVVDSVVNLENALRRCRPIFVTLVFELGNSLIRKNNITLSLTKEYKYMVLGYK